MIGGLHATRTRASVPAIGASVPTATLHLGFLAVAAGLCVLVFDDRFWLGVGLLLAVAGTFVPNVIAKGWVIFVLGVSQLWREPTATDITFYVLLSGVHFLHVVDSLTRQIPWHARMQWVAFVRPLQRFVVVQTVVQFVAAVALFSVGGERGTVPGLSIFAAVVLGVVALVLAFGLRHGRRS